jgi:hypothetical protein
MPNQGFTKIDNDVSRIKDLSDSAIRYYVFMAGIKNGKTITDAYTAKALGWSSSKIKRARTELKKYDLVLMKTIHRGLHYLFVGNTIIGASDIEEYAILDEDDIDILTLEKLEIRRRRK